MAGRPSFRVKENEFYEILDMPLDTDHPYPELRGFKIIMVSKMTPVGDGQTLVVCKWPSIESLTNFFNQNLRFLPKFDMECTITEHDLLLLPLGHADLVDLCFRRLPSAWLDHQREETLNAALNSIGVDHVPEVETTHIMPDQLYEINHTALPPMLRVRDIEFARIALVSRVTEDPDDWLPTMDVRVPSMESVDAFLSSESLVMPNFNRLYTVNIDSERPFLKRVLPIKLCFRMRNSRDLWIMDTDN